MKDKKNVAIILAAGVGSRFNKDGGPTKQMAKLAGKPILLHTLEKFSSSKFIDEIVVVANIEILDECTKILAKSGIKKLRAIIKGGKTRQESSRIGIFSLENGEIEKVLIHDAVRPFVSEKIIKNVVRCLDNYVSVDVAIPTPDTLIEINEKRIIKNIPKRSSFFRGQTPQGFSFETIKKAHEMAIEENYSEATDDCGLIIRYGLGETFVVDGDEYNMKITYPLDIHIADKIFQIKNIKIENPDIKKNEMLNKNIVIFGYSSGIGKEIFKICRNLGANAVGFSRKNGCDICDRRRIKKVMRTFY